MLAALPGIQPFKGHLLFYVNKQASSLLSCGVTTGSITIDLLQRRIVAGTIVLTDPHGVTKPLCAERVVAQITISAMLKGRFELRSITITGLSGDLVQTKRGLSAGPVDITRLSARLHTTTSKPMVQSNPMVREIIAERCRVSYWESESKIKASETIQSVRLDFIRADSFSYTMQSGAGQFSSPVWSGKISSFDVNGYVGPGSILFNNAEIRGDSILLSVNGTIPFSMKKTWDLTANAEAFVAGFSHVYKRFPSLYSTGKIKVIGTMSGTIANPVLKLTATG